MKIIVGLGNPGAQYETTRHNVGFLALDRLVDQWKATGPNRQYQGLVYRAQVGQEKIYLVKPQTFMNLSGQCVGPLYGFYQCSPQDLLVIHDDLAIPAAEFKLKIGGGTGGHNGLQSIDEALGKAHQGYCRLRIGIGHPTQSERSQRMSPSDYVLQPFYDDELQALDPVLEDVVRAAEYFLQGDLLAAMNRFHQKSKQAP
jgi:PTH1 family peptidyl-tRNA hydrolase